MKDPNSGYFKVNYKHKNKIKGMTDADEYEKGLILLLLTAYSYHLTPIVIENGWVKVGGDGGIINNFSDMYIYEEDREIVTYLLEEGITHLYIEGVDFDYEKMRRCDVKIIINLAEETVNVSSKNSVTLKGEENELIMDIKTSKELTESQKRNKLEEVASKYEKEFISELFNKNDLSWTN